MRYSLDQNLPREGSEWGPVHTRLTPVEFFIKFRATGKPLVLASAHVFQWSVRPLRN